MIKYGNPEYFQMFWLIIPLIILFIVSKRRYRQKLTSFMSQKMQVRLASSYSPRKALLKRILQTISLVFLILAMVNPKVGTRLVEVKREGIDIVVAVDLSKSMLAEDITPNRLKKTKHVVRNFIRNLKGDRIGLVGFTSQAFTQCPLTTDYSAALMFLDIMDTSLLPQGGTSLAEAIRTASGSFNDEEKKHKLIILISDGEDHEENISEAVKEAVDEGITIYTVGIGSIDGVPIPDKGGFLKDDEGNTVITRLNEMDLRKVAKEGNGNFYISTPTEGELSEIFKDISRIEKKEFNSKMFEDFEDRFQIFLFVGLFLLLLEILISEKKKEEFEY